MEIGKRNTEIYKYRHEYKCHVFQVACETMMSGSDLLSNLRNTAGKCGALPAEIALSKWPSAVRCFMSADTRGQRPASYSAVNNTLTYWSFCIKLISITADIHIRDTEVCNSCQLMLHHPVLQRSCTTLLGCWPVLTCIVCTWSVLIPPAVDWASTAWPGTTRYSQQPPQ